MPVFYFFLLALFSLLINSVTTTAFEKNNPNKLLGQIPAAEYMLENGNLGTEFWIAIPQNEVKNGILKEKGLEIVCAPIRKTSITMSIPELGIVKTKPADAFTTTSFSSVKGELGWTMECSEGEILSNKGIHLTASEPFCVYVMNVKEWSADGYMAIPVCNWDKEYFHCGYWDFFEGTGAERGERGGGFIIIGSENGTSVTVTLNGQGKGVAKTLGGRDIGESWSFNMDAGQTYMVRGDGKTTGIFDITGTKIKASKPIGLVSFQMRTMVPPICPDDRDHLNEMIPPVSAIGKDYVTVQFDRNPTGSRQGKGDLFRAVAIYDNTKVTCDYFDLTTGQQIGSQDLPLAKSGSFTEALPILDINDANTKKSIYGVSHWKSDKPFLLVQLSFSNRWDGDSRFAPFSIVLPSTEQYSKNAVFQTPDQTDFNDNQLTIFAKGDPNDPSSTLLKTITYDGVEIHKTDAKILANRIPETDIYWTRKTITAGTHYITSGTGVAGYIVGFQNANAYGYPMSMVFNKLDVTDTKQPKFNKSGTCGNFTYDVTEPGMESGIANIVLMDNVSTNYKLILDNPANFRPSLKILKQKFYVNLIDNTKPANAVVAMLDRAGNLTYDSVSYEPTNLTFDKTELTFGKVRVNNSGTQSINLKNFNTDSLLIIKVYNKDNKFVISGVQTPFKLAPNQDLTFNVTYCPIRQSVGKTDLDTIFVETNCVSYKFPITGSGIIPIIGVRDWDFKNNLIGTKKCIEEMGVEGLKIDNTGSDNMIVFGLNGIKSPFILEMPTVPPIPFTLKPGETVYLKSLCFIPSDSVDYKVEFTVQSDAFEGDSICTLIGKGTAKPDDPKSVLALITNSFDFQIVPNPSTDDYIKIVYSIDTESRVKIELIALNGNVISELINEFTQKGISETKVFVGNLPIGVYNIKLTNGMKTVSKFFVNVK